MQLCLNEYDLALLREIPSRMDACIYSSYNIVSLRFGIVEKRPIFAS